MFKVVVTTPLCFRELVYQRSVLAGKYVEGVMNEKPLLALTVCSRESPNKGSLIFVECASTEAALRLARRIANDTGHIVTLRDEEMQEIDTVLPPTAH